MKRPAGEGTAQGRRRGRVVLRLFTPFGVWGRRPQRRLRPAGRRAYGVYTRVLSVLSMRPFRTLRLGGTARSKAAALGAVVRVGRGAPASARARTVS